MKLNYKRTVLVGLAFLTIQAVWQLYNTEIPLILTEMIGDILVAANNVTITDCTGEGKSLGDVDYTGGSLVYVTGTFNLYAGTITYEDPDKGRIGVIVEGGTFNMHGGSITGNTGMPAARR